MRLKAQAPLRVREAVCERRSSVRSRGLRCGPIHGLEIERVERQRRESFRLSVALLLWVNELELVPSLEHERRVGFRTDADVIDPDRRGLRATAIR